MDATEYMLHWQRNRVWTHLNWPKHQARFKRIASMLYNVDGRFIDIGCAYGHSTLHLKKFHPGEWSGMDFTMDAVGKARELFPDLSWYFAPDFNLVAHTGARFEGVVCSEVIEHVAEDQELINGLARITKSHLILTTPDRHVSDPGHLRIYDDKMLYELFEKHVKFETKVYRFEPFYYVKAVRK